MRKREYEKIIYYYIYNIDMLYLNKQAEETKEAGKSRLFIIFPKIHSGLSNTVRCSSRRRPG